MRTTLSMLVTLALCLPAAAQPLGDSVDALKKAYDADKKRRRELIDGAKPTKDDVRVAQSAADWHVGRLTHPLPPPTKSVPHPLTKIQSEFAREIDEILAKDIVKGQPKDNRAFVDLFGRALVGSMKKALKGDPRDPATIPEAMMLMDIARLKQDDFGDYLLALIDDPKTYDAVRVYALKALKEYLPIEVQDKGVANGGDKLLIRFRNDVKYVNKLSQYITRPIDVKGLHAEETEAKRYLRREAIVSLAHARAPAALALKDPVKLGKAQRAIFGKDAVQAEGLVAPTLLTVLAGDLTPPPSLQEKLEAVHGLCALEYDLMPEYNPDLAVYLIGRTLIEFASEYSKDRVNFTGIDRKLPTIAWKGESKRLETSLAQLVVTPRGKELGKKMTRILQSTRSYANIDAADLKELRALVAGQRPADCKVFKTIKTPEITRPK